MINDEPHFNSGRKLDIASMTYGTYQRYANSRGGSTAAAARLVGYTQRLLKSRIYHNLAGVGELFATRSEVHASIGDIPLDPEEIDVSGPKQNEDGDFSERGQPNVLRRFW